MSQTSSFTSYPPNQHHRDHIRGNIPVIANPNSVRSVQTIILDSDLSLTSEHGVTSLLLRKPIRLILTTSRKKYAEGFNPINIILYDVPGAKFWTIFFCNSAPISMKLHSYIPNAPT